MDEDKIETLLTKGVLNIYPTPDFLKSKLKSGERLKLYLGIDPTGPTLHLGHLIPILKLAEFQKLGHQIILLIGDFTATIGDPTDKLATRKKLSKEEVGENLKLYKKQASKFISFDGDNKAELRFNSEWLDKMNFRDVLELCSNMTVEQMQKRDMFVKRAEDGKPVFIHEFLYPLMQGYDSVAMDVDGEVGGNDQTFNMLAGRQLMKSLKNKEKFVLTTKLLVDSSGKKMGKTENNLVALDQEPQDMYGRVMSWPDSLIELGFELVTEVSMEKLQSIRKQIGEGVNPKELKMELAFEIVKMCFDEKVAEKAEQNFEQTFAKGGIPEDTIQKSVSSGTALIDVLLESGLVSSKTEFRRFVESGAITEMTNNEKITDPNYLVKSGVYKIGKRKFIEIEVI